MFFRVSIILLSVIFCGSISAADLYQTIGDGGICGGLTNAECKKGLWCDPNPGSCDVSGGLAGVCVAVPKKGACPASFIPVCGCDGKTYSNDCVRQMSRVGKKHDNECGKPPKTE